MPAAPGGSSSGKNDHHSADQRIHGLIEAWRGWEGELAGKTIGGKDHLATAIKQVRAENGSNVLLLDVGDAIGDAMIADETNGEAVLRFMNALPTPTIRSAKSAG